MNALDCIVSAFSTLRNNKIRSFLTAIGVVIGVMSVILLIALGEGAQSYVENEFAGLGSNVILVTPGKQETMGMIPLNAGTANNLTYENSKELKRRLVGVRGVAAYVLGAGIVQSGDRRRNTTILGITPDFGPVRQVHVQLGRFIEQRDLDRNARICLLGTAVKEGLFGNAPALNQKVSINRTKHTVVGIIEPKGMSLGMNLDDLVFIPLPSGQRMFHGGDDKLFEIAVATHHKDAVDYAVEQTRSILIAAHDYTEDFTITDQDGILGSLGKIFLALRIMLVGISSIALIVGGVGIMNIMLVSVRERTREVGIRKAVGATRTDISMQFLVESAVLSVSGGLIGIALGWLGITLVQLFYSSFPLGMSLWSVLTAFFFSLGIGVFFGVYPAAKAASVDPIEALRYE